MYATVLSAFFPHVAPPLFQYQHFITLKTRSYRTAAWLRYDSEFRLKLAANESRSFDSVDTELWASCFAADGLSVNTDSAPPTLACYACGRASHLYAACPQRRQPPLPQPVTAAKQDPPRSHTPANPPSPVGEQREPFYILMVKGAVFVAPAAHIFTLAPFAGGSMPSAAAPLPNPNLLPSTVRPLLLARYLHHHPNPQFVTTLLFQLTHGFDIGYQSPHRDMRAPNLPSAAAHPEVVTEYLRKECLAGRMAGPFDSAPFSPFHC